MHVCIVGKGAREAAIAWKLKRSPETKKLSIWPGNVGMQGLGSFADLPEDASFSDFGRWCQAQGVNLVVVGPEVPLAAGLADELTAKWHVPVFGPSKACAELESSKQFAKEIMQAAGIPTAKFKTVHSREECRSVSEAMLGEPGSAGVVLKASGLAAGKGVFVCTSKEQIHAGLERLYSPMLASAAQTVVVEEMLVGRECSFFCFLGEAATPIGFAVDYKRLKRGDVGPNTGGMGCYTPVPWLPADATRTVMTAVVEPLQNLLSKRGMRYVGCLYVGIMWTKSGPKVIEFNVRLGDPEAQVLAVNDKTDWLKLMAWHAGVKGAANPHGAAGVFGSAVGVVLASAGYPYGENEKPPRELPIEQVLSSNENASQLVEVFCASVARTTNAANLKTGSGRVFTVVAQARNFSEARTAAFAKVESIRKQWPEAQWRSDIAENI